MNQYKYFQFEIKGVPGPSSHDDGMHGGDDTLSLSNEAIEENGEVTEEEDHNTTSSTTATVMDARSLDDIICPQEQQPMCHTAQGIDDLNKGVLDFHFIVLILSI